MRDGPDADGGPSELDCRARERVATEAELYLSCGQGETKRD